MMGAATIPNLCELEAEIERRDLVDAYIDQLFYQIDVGDESRVEFSTMDVFCVTRLTDTQKVQAALKVLTIHAAHPVIE